MTSFIEIYNMNEIIKTDTRLVGKPKNLIYQLYFQYLQTAIGYFKSDCYQDIIDITPFSQIEYGFTGNGTTKIFTLDSQPPIGSLFYVSLDNMETIKYSYDSILNQITFIDAPLSQSDIYIGAYIIGQFNSANLNFSEKDILCQGMIVPWLQQQRNSDQLLHQMVFGTDFKIYSQGAHIEQLNNTLDSQYLKFVMSRINMYSWKENPNGLMGLGGGLI